MNLGSKKYSHVVPDWTGVSPGGLPLGTQLEEASRLTATPKAVTQGVSIWTPNRENTFFWRPVARNLPESVP